MVTVVPICMDGMEKIIIVCIESTPHTVVLMVKGKAEACESLHEASVAIEDANEIICAIN